MRMIHRLAPLLVLALAACSGGVDISEPDAPGTNPNAGRERISVLTSEQQLQADPSIAGVRVILPRPYRNASWPQSGGVPTHAVHHLALGDPLRRAWRVNIGQGSDMFTRLIMSPVVAEGRVFAIDTRGKVSAYSTADGDRFWSTELRLKGEKRALAFGGGLAVAGDRLIVTTGFGFISALDVDSGRELWRYQGVVPFRGAPTVAEGRVFAVTQDNEIVALDLGSGDLLWTEAGLPEDAGILGAASPAVKSDTVVAALSSGELLAMRVENGRQSWQDTLSRTRRLTPLATLADIDGDPIIYRSRVYAVGHAGRMVAIDMRSGERVWENNVASVATPWLAGDYIFVVTVDDEVAAISAADGRIRWVTRLQRFKDIEDRKGPLAWTGPVLAGDRLIVVSTHGVLLTISPYTGAILGGTELPASTVAMPVVADGTLYVLTEDADLIAFR